MDFGKNNLSVADLTDQDILNGFSKCGTNGLPITSDNLNAVVQWLEKDINRSYAFEAGNDNGHTWINNALTVIKYSQVRDKFNVYDASRGEFTAPVNGIWYLEAGAYVRHEDGPLSNKLATTFIEFSVTNSTNSGSHRIATIDNTAARANVAHPKGALSLYLEAGAKVVTRVYQDSGEDKLTNRPTGLAFFRGHLAKRGTY